MPGLLPCRYMGDCVFKIEKRRAHTAKKRMMGHYAIEMAEVAVC